MAQLPLLGIAMSDEVRLTDVDLSITCPGDLVMPQCRETVS
ncbi:hypothetical protein [Streptomyces sp. NPDC002205]